MSILHDRQLRIYVPLQRLDASIGRLLGPMQHQRPPVDEPILGEFSLKSSQQSPFSTRIFAPHVGGHKRPVGESITAIVILWTATQNHGPGPSRGNQIQRHIAASGRVQANYSLHVLDIVDFGSGSNASVRIDFHQQISGRRNSS